MNKQTENLIVKNLEIIPFFEIIFPYVENFVKELDDKLLDFFKNKLSYELLEDLSSYAEVTLQLELNNFVRDNGSDFAKFVKKIDGSLVSNYPILDEKLKTKVLNFSNHISKIFNRFQNDLDSIIEVFSIRDIAKIKILDIETGLGDGHNGEGPR